MLCDVTFVGRVLVLSWAHCVQAAFKTTSVHKETYTCTAPSLLENCPIVQRAKNSLFGSLSSQVSQDNMMILNNDFCLHASTRPPLTCPWLFSRQPLSTQKNTQVIGSLDITTLPTSFLEFSQLLCCIYLISRFKSKMVNIESQLSGYHLVGLPNTSLLLRLYSAMA